MELLSQREFDTWCKADAEFKQQMLAYMQAQTGINLDIEGRISTLQAKQDECAESMSRKTTWISSIISAIVGGIVGAFTGGMK